MQRFRAWTTATNRTVLTILRVVTSVSETGESEGVRGWMPYPRRCLADARFRPKADVV